jgi:toxin ParE1/3/4
VADSRIKFHAAAQAELEHAVDYYEARESGLGEQFLSEVQRVVSLVTDYPEIGAEIWETRRRVLLNRFPYALIYRILRDGRVRILAVMHLRQRPRYWLERV